MKIFMYLILSLTFLDTFGLKKALNGQILESLEKRFHHLIPHPKISLHTNFHGFILILKIELFLVIFRHFAPK